MKKKEYYIALTGATSTIGLAIIKECINNKKKLLAICNPDSSRIGVIPVSEYVDIEYCEIDKYEQLHRDDVQAVKCKYFIHLAWTSTTNAETRNQVISQEANIRYTLEAVKLAHRLGCEAFVGAGSQAEYGRKDTILTEDMECNPETAYGIAKLCAGQLSRLACKQLGLRHVWPRILSVYGENCKSHTIVTYTMNELMNGRKPSLSAGDQIWDFLYAEDAACMMIALAEKGKDGEVYLVASGGHRALKDYICEIQEIVAPGGDLGLGEVPYNENAVMHLAADISKLKKDIGYVPQYSFHDGICCMKKLMFNK